MKQIILAVMAVTVLTGPAHAGWGSIGHAFKEAGNALEVTVDGIGDSFEFKDEGSPNKVNEAFTNDCWDCEENNNNEDKIITKIEDGFDW